MFQASIPGTKIDLFGALCFEHEISPACTRVLNAHGVFLQQRVMILAAHFFLAHVEFYLRLGLPFVFLIRKKTKPFSHIVFFSRLLYET